MKSIAARAITIAVAGVLAVQFNAQANTLAAELRASLPGASLSGQAKMRFLGFEVYQASLWVSAGFAQSTYAQSPFALELQYLRDFQGADIARRSVTEMLRQGPLPAELQARWEAQMRALFPDVKAGDRLTGTNQPGVGAVFWHNGRRLGELRDADFANKFFGIWLSAHSSEPQLRQALLGSAAGKPLATGTP